MCMQFYSLFKLATYYSIIFEHCWQPIFFTDFYIHTDVEVPYSSLSSTEKNREIKVARIKMPTKLITHPKLSTQAKYLKLLNH